MRNKATLFFTLFFLLSFSAFGQKQVNSPYSRFNLGTLEPAGSFRSQGLGGINAGMRDNTSVFVANPASYSSFDTVSFIFDFGLDYSMNKLAFGNESYTSDDMNFDHLIIGFPLAKGFGFAAGLLPLSNGYYRLNHEMVSTDPGYDPVVGGFTSTHTGEGGLTNVFLGTGLKVHKYLSAGVNMTILFGQLSRTNKFVFNDNMNAYHNNSSEKLQVGGINFDYGLQFTLPLKENRFFNAGLTFTNSKKYNSDYENFVFRYTSFGTADTVSYTSTGSGALKLPGTIRAGVALGKTNKFLAGLDFVATKWSAANIPGSEGYAADTRNILFGIEYTPEKFSNFNYLKRVDYRLGGHFGDNYLVINGEQLKEMGITAGLGLPLRRASFSKANIFVDYTLKSGSQANGLHNEHYFTVGASLNLYDWWFVQRKYE